MPNRAEREVLVTVRRTRGRVAVAAVAAVGGLLAGCSGQPGTAAVVDGRTITTAELAQAYEQLQPIYNGAGAGDVLGVLITEPFAVDVAAAQGVGVNDEQALDLLRTVAVQAVGEEEAAELEFGPGAIAVGRYSLATSALQDLESPQAAIADYQERVTAADIEVNPRYGEFTDDFAIQPVAPSWIVPEGGRDAAGQDATPAPAP